MSHHKTKRKVLRQQLADADQQRVSLLTVVHDQLDDAPKTAARVAGPGWMRVLSGLKTVLETGDSLNP